MIKYHAFIKVVEFGSITKAAKDLGYSQPGVSHMIDALEAEVGFPLLARSKDRIVPTEDGKKVLECCYSLVREETNLNSLVQSITGLVTGQINIGALNSLLVTFVPRIVSTFNRAYSSIDIRIKEKSFGELQTELINGSVDIAFISECKSKGFEFRPLFNDPICLAMPENHPFAKYDKIHPTLLNGCDVILPEPGWDDTSNAIIDAIELKPNVKHYVASDTAAIAMVKENMGVYIQSRMQSANLPDGVIIRDFEGDYHRTIGFAVRSLKNISPALNEFIKTTKYIVENSESISKLIK